MASSPQVWQWNQPEVRLTEHDFTRSSWNGQ